MTYVSGINHGRETGVLRLRTNIRHEFDSCGDNKVFFNLVIMYCLNFGFFGARGMYCLNFGFFVARGMHCLKLV